MTSPPTSSSLRDQVALVSVDMGYGHLRAAWPLAEALGCPVLELDRPPLATAEESRRWQRTRAGYELISRASQLPLVGRTFRWIVDALTDVPSLHGRRSHAAPTAAVTALERMYDSGLGATLAAHLKRHRLTLLTTFYAPAIVADLAGLERIVCVVTDADCNRVWAPRDARSTRIHYCAPSERVRRRLLAIGVPAGRVHLTGFPLPASLTGGPTSSCCAGAWRGGSPGSIPRGCSAPRCATSCGTSSATSPMPRPTGRRCSPSRSAAPARSSSWRAPSCRRSHPRSRAARCAWRWSPAPAVPSPTSCARRSPAAALRSGWAPASRCSCEPDFATYYGAFCELMERTDILWTKPSEMTFYGALGIPLVLSAPIGSHERFNRRWARERGAGLKQNDPRHAREWLAEWLEDGVLAAAAWSGYLRLPKFGTQRVLEVVERVVRE